MIICFYYNIFDIYYSAELIFQIMQLCQLFLIWMQILKLSRIHLFYIRIL